MLPSSPWVQRTLLWLGFETWRNAIALSSATHCLANQVFLGSTATRSVREEYPMVARPSDDGLRATFESLGCAASSVRVRLLLRLARKADKVGDVTGLVRQEPAPVSKYSPNGSARKTANSWNSLCIDRPFY